MSRDLEEVVTQETRSPVRAMQSRWRKPVTGENPLQVPQKCNTPRPLAATLYALSGPAGREGAAPSKPACGRGRRLTESLDLRLEARNLGRLGIEGLDDHKAQDEHRTHRRKGVVGHELGAFVTNPNHEQQQGGRHVGVVLGA